MAEKCLRCGKRRGNRYCPVLAGPICSRCCGENRLVKISCPSTCSHLLRHEAFQRDKQGSRYHEVWLKVNEDLRGREADLKLIIALEYLLKRVAEGVEGLTDADVEVALAELTARVGPIELVTQAPSLLGRLLWEELAPQLEEGRLLREPLKEGLTRLAKMVASLREPEVPRAFLRGLFAHLEELLPEEKQQEQSGLIVTPSDLRRLI